MPSILESLHYDGNSKKMLNAVLSEVPMLFRSVVKHKIEAWVVQNNIKTVTENLVFQAVDEIAPKDLAAGILPALNQLRTK